MSNECAHTLESGNKCHAPALTGNAFCRHHDLSKRMDASRASEPFVLPEFYDARGVLRAVNQVCRALTEQRIKRSTAGTLLFGLQFAARLIREIKEETKAQPETALPDFTPAPAPETDSAVLSDPLERICKVAAEEGVDEAAKLWVKESRQPGDNSPITPEELEDAREALTVLLQTGDPIQVLAAMDARMEALSNRQPSTTAHNTSQAATSTPALQ